MKDKWIFILAMISVFSILPLSGQALMVEDPTEWSKTAMVYKQLVQQLQVAQQQYAQLQQQYQLMNQQYQQIQQMRADAEGHYGYGNLLNTVEDLAQREWSPPTWQDALQGLSGGNPARYQQLLQSYTAAHPTLSQTAYVNGASPQKAEEYAEEIQTNDAASVNASFAFNDVQQQLNHIYALSSNIEKTNDTKAATDLNGRLLTEIAYVQVQQLKMQTVLNEQLAQQGARQIEASTEAAEFNTIP